ncbi:MAG: hypothetical protein HY683_06575 [Chloroflexi bacterium]|nr:hypothetical protein [Chloroflexota bacterium]
MILKLTIGSRYPIEWGKISFGSDRPKPNREAGFGREGVNGYLPGPRASSTPDDTNRGARRCECPHVRDVRFALNVCPYGTVHYIGTHHRFRELDATLQMMEDLVAKVGNRKIVFAVRSVVFPGYLGRTCRRQSKAFSGLKYDLRQIWHVAFVPDVPFMFGFPPQQDVF